MNRPTRYTQARIGNVHAPETTSKFVAATFEHDTARPVDGYAAPQLHTHAVVFNVTERDNGQTRALQERSLFQSQQYATTVYRSELALKLQSLGYEIERGKHGQPEIKGYSQEYLEASSPRRVQIKEHLQEIGREGAGAAQVAAHRTRDSKELHSPEEVLQRHRELAARFGHQADRVVAKAQGQLHEVQPEKTAQQSVTYSRNHVFERSAVQDERAILQAAIDRSMGQSSYSQVRREFEQRVARGEFREIARTDGRAAPLYTTAEMMRMEREIVGHMQRGNQWSYSDPMLVSSQLRIWTEDRHPELNRSQCKAVDEIFISREKIVGLDGVAGAGKTTTLEAPGFRRLDLMQITANTQDHLEQNFKLTVGSASESVTVSSEARIDVGTSVSTTVDQDFVKNMPLNGRDFQSLIAITPGAVRTSGAGLFSFNGQRDNTNYFTVDGVSANTGVTETYGVALGQSGAGEAPELSALGTTSSLLSLDALDEIKIQSANYMPEYGRSAGGQIQLTSRGGTDSLHGSVFDYLRNDDFDAMNSYTKFLNATTGTMLRKPPLRMNNFGGTLGGPLRIPHLYNGQDKTFFFFSYEGLRLKQPTSGEAEVPPLNVRNTANIYPQLLPYIELAPPPNVASDEYGNPALAASYSNPSSTNNTSLRVDEVLNSRLTFFARYAYAPSYSASRSIYSINEVDTTHGGSNGLTVGSTFQISPRMVNQFRGNWTKVDGNSVSALDTFAGSTLPTAAMYAQMFPAQYGASTGNSLFTFGAYPSWSFSYQVGTVTANTQRQVNLIDSVSYQRGSHNIKVGVDWRYLFPIAAPTVYSPNVVYYDPADLLSGDATVGQVQSQDKVVVHQQDIAFYAEDSWRVTPHLLMNYGLRYDLDPPPHAVDGQSLFVVANPTNAAGATLAPAGTPMYATNKTQFAPRIGVSYELTNVTGFETLLKGGYGLFYVPSADTALQATNFFPHNRDTAVFGTNWFTNPLAPIPATLTPPYTNQNILGYYPGFTTPRTHEWNASIQQNVGRAQSFTIAYVGSAGRKLTRLAQFSGGSSTNQYLYLDEFYAADSSDYNSLQLSYVRRMSHGLQVLANYVWGKSMDTASGDTVVSTSPTGLSVAGERGLSDFNVKNSFNLSFDWQLPKLNTSHRFLSAPLNGWGMDAIFEAHDGTPLTVTLGYELASSGTTNLRPDIVAGQPIWISAPTHFGGKELNPAAFSYAYALTNAKPQGDEARNAIPGLSFAEFEYTIRRDFKVKDKLHLQYRCDFFNLFNQTNYAAPSTELGYIYNGKFTSAYQFGTIRNTLSSGGFFGVGGARQLQMALRVNF